MPKGFKHTKKIKKKLSLLSKKQWKDGRVSTRGLFKKGFTPWNKGKKMPPMTKEQRKNMSVAGKRKVFTKEHKENISKALNGRKRNEPAWNKGKKFPQYSKENSPLWKGGIKKDNDRRKSYEAVNWRIAVFKRDNYTCQTCKKVGGTLQAHHIKGWAKYKKLRYVVDNGITLCVECHKLTSNYAGKKNG